MFSVNFLSIVFWCCLFLPWQLFQRGVWGDICQHFFLHRRALCLVSGIEWMDGCSIHKTSVSWNEFLEYCQVIPCNIETLCFRVPQWWKSTPAFSQVEVQFPAFSGNVEYNFHAKWQERWKPWSEMFRNLATDPGFFSAFPKTGKVLG